MLLTRHRIIVVVCVACTLGGSWFPVRSQEVRYSEVAAQTPKATITNQDPKINIEELELLTKPLTKEELENEAAAWLLLLKAKVSEISKAEIAIRRNDRVGTKEAEMELVVKTTKLQDERSLLIDRFHVVLRALEAKGGEVKQYQQYIKAVRGLELDWSDPKLLWLMIVDWSKSSEGGRRWALNIGKFLGIMAASTILSLVVGKIVNIILLKVEHAGNLFRKFIVMLINRGGIVVGFLVSLTALEVSLAPILTLVGGTSFILAFAFQHNLGNLASGLMLMFYKPFDVGDEIELAGIWGFVESITLASTIVKTDNNEIIILPNNSVWDGMITNNTTTGSRRIDLPIRIGFSENIPKVEELLIEIAKSHPKVLEDPKPKTKVASIGDSFITVRIRPWVIPSDYRNVSSDLFRMIKARFDKEGISIPYPQHDVHVEHAALTATTDLTPKQAKD